MRIGSRHYPRGLFHIRPDKASEDKQDAPPNITRSSSPLSMVCCEISGTSIPHAAATGKPDSQRISSAMKRNERLLVNHIHEFELAISANYLQIGATFQFK